MRSKPPVYVTARTPMRDFSPKRCSHWAGCSEPPLAGRVYCAKHAARTDEISRRCRDAGARNDFRRIAKQEGSDA